jgi:hypothetical protein
VYRVIDAEATRTEHDAVHFDPDGGLAAVTGLSLRPRA